MTERFSSSDFAGLKNVDGLDELPGPPWAAAELFQDSPCLELGVGALAWAAELRRARLAVFCEVGLLLPRYGGRK
jgi:hypothetical protein